MSKYSRELKNKEWRKKTRMVNKKYAEKLKSESGIDNRSTIDTFLQWCKECTDGQVYYQDGVLSILGSDGVDITDTKLGDAPFNNPGAVDQVLEDEGYYETGDVMCGMAHYDAPEVHYLEWFNKKFPGI